MADRTCSIEGCPSPSKARGWCDKHWKIWRAHGDPEYVREQQECSIPDCSRPGVARGWCDMHWKRWKAHGDPLYVRPERKPAPCSIDGCQRVAKARGWCAMHNTRWERRGTTGDSEAERVRAYAGQACSVEGCEKFAEKLGWCGKHWMRWRTHGDTETVLSSGMPPRDPSIALCSVEGCEKAHSSRGWCQMHYQRWVTHGDALYIRPVQICERDACDQPVGCRGLCRFHYGRWYAARNRQYFRDAAQRRRAFKLALPAESFSELEIFERDGWICGLCDLPVDEDLNWPHPMSPSLDHILPLTRGGHHVRVNCQLAHLRCNVKKGNRITSVPPLNEAAESA